MHHVAQVKLRENRLLEKRLQAMTEGGATPEELEQAAKEYVPSVYK